MHTHTHICIYTYYWHSNNDNKDLLTYFSNKLILIFIKNKHIVNCHLYSFNFFSCTASTLISEYQNIRKLITK